MRSDACIYPLFSLTLQNKFCEVRLRLGTKNEQVRFILPSACTNFASGINTTHDMATSTLRRTASFRFPPSLLETLKMRAKDSNRSLNNYVEELLSDAVSERPNPVTLAAIEEARSGKELETLDMENFKQYVASL